MITIYNLLGGNTLLAGALCHGNTMLIAATDKKHVLALQAQVTHIDVGGNINASQVADVNRTVSIGQRRCYQRARKFLFFLHFIVILILIVLVEPAKLLKRLHIVMLINKVGD